ncbi:hypothetical protein [Alishewanella sp. SMS8]|uniref:hypothetical protein n=1 Tax=Alishewanella sp. SMS8 TaxID=2994676 RepID=UPI002742659F|nr:hypothetical protein [Alishewanella sp. SMS8]MDP4945097.1 hypothetical protein [Alishewanella sp.]MDP5187464.1 hypothetical protein [Alishewanella sp.]MDP5460881.1 hypothetical protein [Alishewanella sp. SMS8]
MTMYSQTHFTLLKQLAVVPLQPKSEFYSDCSQSRSAEATDARQSESITNVEASKLDVLVADIECLLASFGITDWQINPNAVDIHFQEQQLITPSLVALKQPMLKRQLWLLLSEYVDA